MTKMQVRNFILLLLFFPIILSGQYSSYPWINFNLGDTLTISVKSGFKLRDSSSADSKVIALIPFNTSVIAIGNHIGREVFENRNGKWLKVKYGDLEGYVFSGFVTKMTIPQFGPEDLRCWNLEWFEKFIRANVDSSVCKGQKIDKGFHPHGDFPIISNWEIFTDETVIYHVMGFESEDLIIESTVLNMNDILNLLEVYIDKIKQECPRFESKEEANNLEIDVRLDNEGYIKAIECSIMNFSAEKSIYKTIIRLNLWNT